ncbi:MAG: glutaminase A [Limisphaerales bacterium]
MDSVSRATSPILDYLRHLHDRHRDVREGQVATYIPELARANPDWFGICLVTAGGSVYEVGDTAVPFTIQSISKPFVYGLALEDQGRADVLRKVGVEPTGDAFNSISLEPGTGRPRNPMINAGAIASTGLIAGKTPAVRLQRILDLLSGFAGRPVALDATVFDSENETGHRNRAIGHMLRNFDILDGDPTPAVQLYFQQCSVAVTCRDLAVMAATLANRGVNPVTGRQAIRGEYVESILSVMASCGMYDYAGEWLYNIGMPAKSGVAGGIIAVLPGKLGIGVFSPPLDARGNSVRGIRVCDDFSRHVDLHLFNSPAAADVVIRLRFTGAEYTSSRARPPADARRLRELGAGIQVYQLQGHLTFATAEVLLREALARLAETRAVILDWKRVVSLTESAARLLYELLLKLDAEGIPMLVTHADGVPLLRRYLKLKLGPRFPGLFRVHSDNDRALEWCEDLLLNRHTPAVTDREAVPRAGYDLFAGLPPDGLQFLETFLERRTWPAGQTLIKAGAAAAEIFFIARGRVSVLVPLANGGERRLATFSAGMHFGEMAVLDGAPRSADVVADTEVECDCLPLAALERLGAERPEVHIRLLRNLGRDLSQRLRRANRELAVFA